MTRTCSHCKSEDCFVAETRLTPFWPFKGNIVRRRRKCRKCHRSWWTDEIPEDMLIAMARRAPEEVLGTKQRTFVASTVGEQEGED